MPRALTGWRGRFLKDGLLPDVVLWALRIAALVAVAWGSYNSISSGRLSASRWGDLVVAGISQGSIYGLIALGYTMVYGVLRFINFAHGEVFMAGGMLGFFVAAALAETPLWSGQPVVALLLVLLTCMSASSLVALLLERVAYRPLRAAPRLIPFITAIGASLFLRYAFAGLFGPGQKNWPAVEALQGPVVILGFRVLKTEIVSILAALAVMGGLYLLVERTRAGSAIRAVAEDQEVAGLMGISVDRTIARVFALGGAMAGMAALLWGLVFGQADFSMGFVPGIKGFTAAVLGGVGNIVGAAVGGLILGLAESLGPSLVLVGLGIPSAHQFQDVVAFLVLILILVFRPTGLLGERLAEERP